MSGLGQHDAIFSRGINYGLPISPSGLLMPVKNHADLTDYERFIVVDGSFMLSKYNFRWLYTSEFIATTDYYARSLRDKVLPAFDDMSSEDATKVEDEAYSRFASYGDPEWFDPADATEHAVDAGISFYTMAQGVVQGIVNMFTGGLHHLFEQQLFPHSIAFRGNVLSH